MAHMHATQMESAPPRPPVELSSDPIAEISATLLRAQAFLSGCGIGLMVREGAWLVCRAASGAAAPDLGARIPVENSFLGLCVTLKKPQSCENADSDLRVENATYSRLRPKSILAVPVRAEQGIVAVLAGFSSAPNAFTNTQVAILRTVADSLSRPVQQLPLSQPSEEPVAPGPTLVAPQPPQPVRETSTKPEPPAPEPARQTSTKQEPLAVPAPPVLPVPKPRDEVLTLADDVAPRSTVREPQPSPPTVRVVTYTLPRFETPRPQPRRFPTALLRIGGITAACLLCAVVTVGWYSSRIPDAPPRVFATPPAPVIHPKTVEPAVAALSATPAPAAAAPAAPAAKSQPVVEPAPPESRAMEEAVAPEPVAPKLPQPAEVAEAPALVLSAPSTMPALVAPQAAAPKIHHSEVIPARLVTTVAPTYPVAARGRRIAGQVVLSMTVHKDGTVAGVKLLSGNPIFQDSAVEAVKKWRYAPATLDGQPVEATAQVTLKFDPGKR